MLTPEQVQRYEDDGFLVVPDFTPLEQVRALQARGVELVEGYEPSGHDATFSTNNQNTTTDQYFLESANGVGYFFEEGAFGPDGELVRPKAQSVNKLG